MLKILPLFFAILISTTINADSNPIDNFHSILDGKIFRGARPGDDGIDYLAQMGIKTVIDLQGGDYLGPFSNPGESKDDIIEEGAATHADAMQFISIPLSSLNPDFDDQDKKIGQILSFISNPANQPVFFHCYHGEDRTGVVAALYRVIYQGCTPVQAHTEMLQDGHSPALFWIDNYFYDSINKFPPSSSQLLSSCPLGK
jgi:tyrosine-protein phosphatase SIW14